MEAKKWSRKGPETKTTALLLQCLLQSLVIVFQVFSEHKYCDIEMLRVFGFNDRKEGGWEEVTFSRLADAVGEWLVESSHNGHDEKECEDSLRSRH